jgi:hypothetical protein
VPQQKINPKDLYEKIYYYNISDKDNFIKENSVNTDDNEELQRYSHGLFMELMKDKKLSYINLDSVYCSGEKCLIGNSTKSIYKDANHLSEYGAQISSELLNKYLNE